MLPLVGDVKIGGALVAHSKKCLAQGDSASPQCAASCRRDGSFAAIQLILVQETYEVPPKSEGVAARSLVCTQRTMWHRLGKELQHNSPFSNISMKQCSSLSCR